jgi:hypothetical protein
VIVTKSCEFSFIKEVYQGKNPKQKTVEKSKIKSAKKQAQDATYRVSQNSWVTKSGDYCSAHISSRCAVYTMIIIVYGSILSPPSLDPSERHKTKNTLFHISYHVMKC